MLSTCLNSQMLPLPTDDKLMQSSMMSVLDSVSYAIDRVACEVNSVFLYLETFGITCETSKYKDLVCLVTFMIYRTNQFRNIRYNL